MWIFLVLDPSNDHLTRSLPGAHKERHQWNKLRSTPYRRAHDEVLWATSHAFCCSSVSASYQQV